MKMEEKMLCAIGSNNELRSNLQTFFVNIIFLRNDEKVNNAFNTYIKKKTIKRKISRKLLKRRISFWISKLNTDS